MHGCYLCSRSLVSGPNRTGKIAKLNFEAYAVLEAAPSPSAFLLLALAVLDVLEAQALRAEGLGARRQGRQLQDAHSA